jgi:hypothetical protein
MKRLLFLSVIVILAITLIHSIGCEKKPTNSLSTGPDSNNIGLILMKEAAGSGVMDLDARAIELSLSLTNYVPGASAKRAFKPASGTYTSIQIVEHDTANYWHIFNLTAIIARPTADGVDSLHFSGYDSLRFATPDGFIYIPDSTVTSMNVRSHFAVDIIGGDDTVYVGHNSALDLVGAYNSLFAINGAGIDTVLMQYNGDDTLACDISMALNQTYSNLQFNTLAASGQKCPEAGSISIVALLNLECIRNIPPSDTTTLYGLWNMGFVFHNGEVTATYRHGLYSWITTTACGDNSSAKERWSTMMSKLPQMRD